LASKASITVIDGCFGAGGFHGFVVEDDSAFGAVGGATGLTASPLSAGAGDTCLPDSGEGDGTEGCGGTPSGFTAGVGSGAVACADFKTVSGNAGASVAIDGVAINTASSPVTIRIADIGNSSLTLSAARSRDSATN
jgi:hypothetical protein